MASTVQPEAVDMQNRDPQDVNVYLQVGFDDIIAEPEDVRSADCVWRNAFRCYRGSKRCWYAALTGLCALPLACCWGAHFACLSFHHVWCSMPCLNYFKISGEVVKQFVKAGLDAAWVPCCEACGRVFSQVHITLRRE